MDTIFALSSGSLPSAIALARISGPRSRFTLETISGETSEPRRLKRCRLAAEDGTLIDEGMAVFFAAPRSATGEDCAEFHLHGGRAVVSRLFQEFIRLGLRPAEAGEFTRRAFLNGKLDLAQAEAVADLIAAETEGQRRFALGNLEGRQSRLYAEWAQRLLHARAMIEAELDFSDEGDVPGSVAASIWEDMTRLHEAISTHLQGSSRAAILRDGFEVVIVGAPNAGKSSLLNALAQRDVAIVSELPGTTRDTVEVQLDLRGQKLRLVDTAGLRETTADPIEQIGMERTRARAERANLIIELVDLADPRRAETGPTRAGRLVVGNKLDLAAPRGGEAYDVLLSAHTGIGVDALLERLAAEADRAAGDAADVLPSRERHAGHLRTAAAHIRQASEDTLPLELRAEELRAAMQALGHISGQATTEDVLGAVFSSFCIGK